MWLLLACAGPASAPEGGEEPADCAALQRWLPDEDGDGHGDDDGVVLTCDPPEGWTQVEGDCDDADPAVYAGHADVCADGVDADCDGVDPADRVERPWGAEHAGWRDLGDEDGDRFGAAVAGMVGPEGYPQVVVGAPGTEAAAGYVKVAGGVVMGAASRMAPEGGALGDGFGSAIAAGDLTGDGWPDAAIAAPTADGGGAVWLLEATSNTLLPLLVGDPAGAWLGLGLAAGRDATGDGVPDLLASAAIEGGPEESWRGGAWLVAGPIAGPVAVQEAGVAIPSPTFDDSAGAAVDFLDADGDGVAEVILGAPASAREGMSVGAVQIHRPGDDTVRAMVWGADPDGSFGYAASGLGDYDGDGYEDLGVGEPTYRIGEDALGAAYVFLGPFDGERGVDTAALTVRGEEAVDYVGVEVLGADLSGDGVPDFVVGGLATTLDTGPSAAGAVMAYTCAVTGLVGTADASLAWYGETVTGYFGWSAAPVPDVDGDGLVDLLVGAPYLAEGSTVVGAAYLMTKSTMAR